MPQSKRALFPLIVIFMLVLQLMSPITVLADGETPPDPPATEETPPPEEPIDASETIVEDATPTEEAVPVEESSTEDVTSTEGDEATETPPAEESSTPEEPTGIEEAPASNPTEEPASTSQETQPEGGDSPEDLTVAEVLEQAPAETEVLVINAEGQAEPLATEAAAEIVAHADPIWCPDGVTPQDGLNGCSPSFTYSSYTQPLTELINWLRTNDPDVDGTIWIEKDYDSAAEGVAGFTLDGGSFTNLDNNALTIQGGWDGTSGSTAITGISTFNGDYLHIINWSGNVSLNDIVVDGATANGIVVITMGDINVENVTSGDNDGNGAYLNNTIGSSSITLTGTNVFSGNGSYGLGAVSNGDITLNNIAAFSNDDSGVYAELYDAGTLTVKNSTFGSSFATGNGNDGLEAYTDGSVVIENVTAIGNADNGVKVYADYGDGDLTVSNSTFSQNGDEGLEGQTDTGAINITNVFANQNAQFGLWLESYEGNITLNNVTANTNGLGGAVIQTEDGNINVFTGQFNDNGANAVPDCGGGECSYYPSDGGIGLAAASWGETGQIYLENVQAWKNYGEGAWLEGNNVVVRNSTFHFNGLGQAALGSNDLWSDGLYIADLEGSSSAYLECVRANGNAAYGIEIYAENILLNGVTAAGNGWDDFYFESNTLNTLNNPCRTPKDTPDLIWQIVPITGSESIGLNCSAYVGTILVLPNGDEVRLPCPTIGEASLASVTDTGLPGSLPEGSNHVSSFTAQVTHGGVSLETLPASMIVSFVIHEDMLDANLAILYWDGSQWVEVAGAYKTADDRFEASVNYTGVFVLVSK